MATKKVMIEEISKDLFFININSPLIRMIEFGYILHYSLIESDLIEDNSWFDFIFGVNLKIADSFEDVVLFNQSEIKNLLNWLDWICQIIISADIKHKENKIIKEFISLSDELFLEFKHLIVLEDIIIEKIKRNNK